MEKEFGSFRKSTFGGFNRKDVINYIEKMRNESYEYKKQVEETVKSLNEKILELENAARLMEVDLTLCGEAESASDEENMGDINEATKHLKSVADELCRSLGEFMEKLSSKGLFVKSEEELPFEEDVPADFEEAEEEESLIDGILSSLSFLYEEKSVKADAAPVVKAKEKDTTVSDILGGLSFLN